MKVTEELKQFQAMSSAELVNRLRELREEQFRLRTQKATGQLTHSARMRQVRRQIARLHTLIRQRES